MHYYSQNIGDYRRDTSHLSLLEHGVYRQMLDTYYLTEKPLTLDHADLMRTHCARSADEIRAVENVLKDFFTHTKDGYIHKRCDIEIEAFHAKSTSASESAKARWDRVRAEKEANAMRTHSEGNANHKPITNNQEPEDQKPCDQQAESPAQAGPIPYDEILDRFKARLPGFPQPRRPIDDDRRKAVRLIWFKSEKYGSVDFFDRYFKYVGESQFLTDWKGCGFDWLFKYKNFRKVLEGNYHGEDRNA